MYSLILQSKNNFKIPILTNVLAGPEISGPGRAGAARVARVAGRGLLISPGVAGCGTTTPHDRDNPVPLCQCQGQVEAGPRP